MGDWRLAKQPRRALQAPNNPTQPYTPVTVASVPLVSLFTTNVFKESSTHIAPIMVPWIAISFVLLAVLDGAFCADGDICYIIGAKSVILGDRLYFLGGNYTTVSFDSQDIEPVASLHYLDLNSDFPVKRAIPQSLLHSESESIGRDESIAYSNAADYTGRDPEGALWAINDTIYVFGGLSSSPTNQIAAYNAESGEWQDSFVSGGELNFGRRGGATYASDFGSGLGFVVGGRLPYMGGMIRFDGSEPGNLSWTNETLGDGSFGVDVPNLHAGSTLYIPAGNQGMLISLGGRNLTASVGRGDDPPIEVDWLEIFVYDIESHTWWLQRASGNASSNRISFCAAVTESPDGSAFQITTYGGWSRPDDRSYEDVHVLSILAFEWIDASDQTSTSNAEDDPDREIGRDVLTSACTTYRGSQMIVLGGDVRTGRSSVTDGECSNLYYPVRGFDLSTYEWRTNLDTEGTYEVPPLIYREIGGDTNLFNFGGGATTTIPASGFADETLASLITKRTTPVPSPSRSDNPEISNPGSQDQSRNNDSTNVGAIAGGTSSPAGNNSSNNHATTTSLAGTSFPSAVNEQGQPLSNEEADRLYEERMEEEYAKREGGA
ncbi:hypothetical protein BDV19DRAFT_393286 [Aspergillus venezuelensis]